MSTELTTKTAGGLEFTVPTNRNTELDQTLRVANVFAQSGFFEDASDVAKSCVKIMAGGEMGFGPFASMNGVYVITSPATEKRKAQTKVMIGSTLMAAAVMRAGYKYRVKTLTNHGCVLEFYGRGGELLGESEFTTQDANNAGLIKDWSNWKKHPRNMYFARAMSNGVKWYCPDVFAGVPVYVPEEFGEDEISDPLEIPHRGSTNGNAPQPEVVFNPGTKPQSERTNALQAKLDAKKNGERKEVTTDQVVSQIPLVSGDNERPLFFDEADLLPGDRE